MTANAVVRRWLKVADPSAITARETLQRSLDMGRALADIRRSEVFAFTSEGTESGLRGALVALARDTNLIRNPNKHHVEVATGDEPLHPTGNGWVLVFEAGEGDELAEVIARRRLLPVAPSRVRRATLWEIHAAGGGPEGEALVKAIATARERRQGLLANPHFQEVRILTRNPTARDIVTALAGADMARTEHHD